MYCFSKDNRLLLKKEIELLKQENANFSETAEKYSALNSVFEAKALVEKEDYENALICLEKIDKKCLEGSFALEDYEKLYEIVKENTKND